MRQRTSQHFFIRHAEEFTGFLVGFDDQVIVGEKPWFLRWARQCGMVLLDGLVANCWGTKRGNAHCWPSLDRLPVTGSYSADHSLRFVAKDEASTHTLLLNGSKSELNPVGATGRSPAANAMSHHRHCKGTVRPLGHRRLRDAERASVLRPVSRQSVTLEGPTSLM